jgi:hypothetical protein
LFRRNLGTDPTTGMVNPRLEKEAVDRYYKEMGMANPNGGMGITAN